MKFSVGKLSAIWLLVLLNACAGPPNRAPVVGQPGANTVSTDDVDPNGLYIVRSGDTLYSIALAFGLDWRELAKANGISDPSRLSVGQRLVVREVTAASEVKPVTPRDQAEPIRAPTPQAPETKPSASDTALGFVWPHNGTVIRNFKAGVNKGIDLAAKVGDPVIASLGGKVVYSGNALRGYGNLVIVKHDNNLLTAYAHNQTLLVKEGDLVKQGQRIAEAGQSDAERPMLHFEVRKQGKPVNPLDYLPRR